MYHAAKGRTSLVRCLFTSEIQRQDQKTREQIYLAAKVSNKHLKGNAITGTSEDNLPDKTEPMTFGRMQQSNSHRTSKAPKGWIIEKQRNVSKEPKIAF